MKYLLALLTFAVILVATDAQAAGGCGPNSERNRYGRCVPAYGVVPGVRPGRVHGGYGEPYEHGYHEHDYHRNCVYVAGARVCH